MHSRPPVKLIKSSEIRQNFSMAEAIDAMAEAFASLSSGESFVPQRHVTSHGTPPITLLLKPAFVESKKKVSIKILTQKTRGAMKEIPAIIGIVMLMDTLTGEVLSIMDGEYLTALRTGAASGLATKYFARAEADTLAVFGCGAQGRTQLEAVAAVRNISKVWVFDNNRKVTDPFISEMKIKVDADIKIAKNLDVLQSCDIICTATNSGTPLFLKKHLKKGVHINAIGSYKPMMQELDPAILLDAAIYVDQMEPCLAESGDLIKPINSGLFTADHLMGEIGNFILGKINGRCSGYETTVFKSVGVAIQDFAVANKIYEKSLTDTFGQEIRLFD